MVLYSSDNPFLFCRCPNLSDFNLVFVVSFRKGFEMVTLITRVDIRVNYDEP